MTSLVHVILDSPQPGNWNMAVDEALLEESLRTGLVFLRLYRWSEATVSLGYFQSQSEQRRDPRLSNLPSVRRLSGGGAILHHHEQTYSCSLPPSHPLAREPQQLYEEVHRTFHAWLSELGIDVARRGQTFPNQEEPFLCFQRRAPPDLMIGEAKVLGSAQRRRRGAVLQHGSLLLRASEHVPEVLGLCELAPRSGCWETALRELPERLARRLGADFEFSDLPTSVRRRAAFLTNERGLLAAKPEPSELSNLSEFT